MYVIVMNDKKQLIPTFGQNIYVHRGENLIDKIRFLLPQNYDNYDLFGFNLVLQYLKYGIIIHEEQLIMDDIPLKEGRLSYSLTSDTALVKRKGVVEIRLKLSSDEEEVVLETSSCKINMLPAGKFHHGCHDKPCDTDSDRIEELESEVEIIFGLLKNKADNMVINQEENGIQLTSSGENIGEPISLDFLKEVINSDSVINVVNGIVATKDEIESFLNNG